MTSSNRKKLHERVSSAAAAALERQGHVSPIDVLAGIGWLDASHLKRWQQGQLPYLEAGMQTKLSRITEAMKLFRAWAIDHGLHPSETAYVAKTPQRQALQFSKNGDATLECHYRTHWISPELSEKKRERLREQASRPPELVVTLPLNKDWACHRCGGSGALLMMENEGPACLGCAGLGALEFLPAGDAKLTRRARMKSSVSAVVVRFSRARKRYERQGLLVEVEALLRARQELENASEARRPASVWPSGCRDTAARRRTNPARH